MKNGTICLPMAPFVVLVGMAGFEPTASSTPCWRDTGLRYIPNQAVNPPAFFTKAKIQSPLKIPRKFLQTIFLNQTPDTLSLQPLTSLHNLQKKNLK